MVTVTTLWLPVLLSAVLVFVVSSLIHMVLGYHARDHARLPDEAGVRAALRPFAIPPGDYSVPHAGSMKEMGSPEFGAKMQEGPVALLTVRPTGSPGMGPMLGLWFLHGLAVAVVAAYIAGRALGTGAEYLDAFRFAGTAAFACYAMGEPIQSIWFGRRWSTTARNIFDGLVYALVVGGVFGWLWP
jgi:hypothetical protein